MDFPLKKSSQLKLIFAIMFLIFRQSITTTSDYNTFVYSKCSNHTYNGFSDSNHLQTLSNLFEKLTSQSSHSKFSKATSGDINLGISGMFQCRGDLGSDACKNCVKTLPQASNNLCKGSVSARVQLSGCYVHYETDGYNLVEKETYKHQLLHTKCSKKKAVVIGFEEARNAVFAAMESEIESDNGFYYEHGFDYIYVVAQCEGDLGHCDCSECLSIAVQVAEEECGGSISGQIYLDKCYLSYAYSPDGVRPGYLYPDHKDKGNGRGRLVAIVVGGGAALLGAFIFLKFIKSRNKKDDI